MYTITITNTTGNTQTAILFASLYFLPKGVTIEMTSDEPAKSVTYEQFIAQISNEPACLKYTGKNIRVNVYPQMKYSGFSYPVKAILKNSQSVLADPMHAICIPLRPYARKKISFVLLKHEFAPIDQREIVCACSDPGCAQSGISLDEDDGQHLFRFHFLEKVEVEGGNDIYVQSTKIMHLSEASRNELVKMLQELNFEKPKNSRKKTTK